MSEAAERTFTGDFKRWFLRGLVVLLPTVLTLWIIVEIYAFIDAKIATPINDGVKLAMVHSARVWEPLQDAFDPTSEELAAARTSIRQSGAVVFANQTIELKANATDELIERHMRRANIHRWWNSHWYMQLIGLLLAIIAVYIAGRLLGGFFGRRIYRKVESVITTLPVFKQVYPYIKQIVDFLFSDDRQLKFGGVVAVEYPRKGIWSVGFMTGDPMRTIKDHAGDSVTIFVPSSPTPFTGYTITVPHADVIEMPISVEEAIRFAVSGGVLIPPHQMVGPGPDKAVAPQLARPASPHAGAQTPGAGLGPRDNPGQGPPEEEPFKAVS